MELDVRTIKIVLFLAHNLPANEASLSLDWSTKIRQALLATRWTWLGGTEIYGIYNDYFEAMLQQTQF